jgi:hypothetical protein
VTNPSSNPTQAMTVDQIRNMSREDFAKNREAILKAAKDGMIK